MSSLLIKNALAVITVDDEDRILENGNILIRGRRHHIHRRRNQTG